LALDLSLHHRTRCVTESRNQGASGVRAVCSGTTTYPSRTLVVAPNVVTPTGIHQNPHNEKRLSAMRRFLFDCYFSSYYIAWVMTHVSRWLKSISLFVRRSGLFRSDVRPGGPREIEQGVGAIYILRPQFFAQFEALYYEWFLYGKEACLAWQLRSLVRGFGSILLVRSFHSHSSCGKSDVG
jgi:hypothetical protein